MREDFLALAEKLAPDEKTATAEFERQYEHVMTQLMTKDWSKLEVIENADGLLFPDNLYRRRADGTFEETPVLLKVPREYDARKARVMARKIAKDEKLDLQLDKDLVENLETTCLMSLCVLNAKPGVDPRDGSKFHEPWVTDPLQLEKQYDRESLTQLWAKIDNLSHVVDPRPDVIGNAELLVLIAKIAEARNIAPLLVYGSAAQNTSIVSMANLLLSLLASKSSSESSD